MPRPRKVVPEMKCHISGQARVYFDGQYDYLGPHGTAEAQARYDSLVAKYLTNGRKMPAKEPTHQIDQVVTVSNVTAEYCRHAAIKFLGSYQERMRAEGLCTTLEDEYGNTPADQFGPIKLAELRDLFFVASGNSRKYANRQTNRIINIFRHAVSRELIDFRVVERLRTLEPLRYGQTKTKETKPVMPVDIETVRLTAQHLSPR